ncbi:putative role in replication [Lactococcus lactis subsp. lactis]|uniref:hypothetical protein n=1 Tax=Lactococcus lactis TaxID=1358 RepID=UPI00071DD80C|nr:hypothetical protein [Lactococcus lactis]ARE09867.1 hypothetical protein LLUC063_0048 [Lactococcus lactis subsp. lactis]KSU31810.1 putative role in replication [Lactococcus lactis subsp. lactis]UPG97917.1 hypothetical protein MXM90_12355 [Lactococcus lactis]URL08919.1 hypothetical protein L1704_00570 [Lactococcus lactis subsp. lactis]GEB08705.1 hypothetical protein LLA03_12900 [Lactococcus lactis subsp. lactis]
MEVKYKNKSVEVWEISKTNEQPDWVKQAFKENYLSWYDDRLKILLTGINPTAKRNIKLGIMNGILSVRQGFGGTYAMGNIGDFLDITNGRVISKKYFIKHYYIKIDDE